MSKLNFGGTPKSVDGGTNFWKPEDGKDNFVVLLSNPDPDDGNIAWSAEMVKMFTKSPFGKAYPINATWVYSGSDDPKNVLAPELKLQYTGLVMVAYQDGGEWKLGVWQVSMPVHRALATAASVNDVVNKFILVKKEGKNWTVSVAGKMKVPAEALKVADKIPSQEEQEKIFGVYENADDVWAMLMERADVDSREELMTLFGKGDSELL